MKEDTKWRLRDSEGKEYVIIDSEKVDMQEELNKMITKQMKEIERLHSIINQIEGVIYNEQLTGIEARLTIQEILEKEKDNVKD